MAENALHDSAADQDIPLCQRGTRVAILNRINAWADAAESETIFWVSGPAGTGKSTISRSLARSLADTGKLGATYFFKRGEEGRNGTALIFPTIANQLINQIPMFRTCLRKSLEKLGNAKVENKALEEQFKTLLQIPLSELFPDKSGTLTRVIIIDALDECERYDHVSRILTLLSQLQPLNTVRLRVFLTSRSTPPIVGAFKDLRKKHAKYRCLTLDEELSDETKTDISAFLKERFATIKADCDITEDPWPHPNDLCRLVSLATTPSPLFIYAATLCRFVDDGTKRKKPTKQLALWLEQSDKNKSQLNQIYMPILHQLLSGDEHRENASALDEDQSQIMQILSSIILLATPLPARNLAGLLGIDDDDVNYCLRNLHAVLNVPTDPRAPVRLLHKSFSDFLLGDEGTGTDHFRVHAAERHTMLASKCIQRMTTDNGLRKDICDIREPGKSRAELDKAIVNSYIPPDLDYACLYWVYHLQHSGQRITDGDKVYTFLYSFFLYWLEALSLTGRISQAIGMIDGLLTIVDVRCILVSRPYMY
jgi:hypothetical protein